jgi:RNA polymerase sigma-70 factor (ECF subfamily)
MRTSKGNAPQKLVTIRQPESAAECLSDEAVALACSTRDPVAVTELFERFRRLVARYLSRLLRDPRDVEDCLQSTFLEVARGRAQFSGRSSASTWLLGVATNVARHHQRSVSRRARLGEALQGLSQSPDRTQADSQLEARQRLTRLKRALDALTPERREAFVLCEMEGLSAREAAKALGSSETAVWKRVSEARRSLRAATGDPS